MSKIAMEVVWRLHNCELTWGLNHGDSLQNKDSSFRRMLPREAEGRPKTKRNSPRDSVTDFPGNKMITHIY